MSPFCVCLPLHICSRSPPFFVLYPNDVYFFFCSVRVCARVKFQNQGRIYCKNERTNECSHMTNTSQNKDPGKKPGVVKTGLKAGS